MEIFFFSSDCNLFSIIINILENLILSLISPGRKNDFEIFLNGDQIFSKRAVGYFPDLDCVLEEVAAATEDENYKPRTVEETEYCCSVRYTSCCQIS